MNSGCIYFNPSFNTNMLFLGSGESFFRGRSAVSMEETSKRRPFFGSSSELYDDEYLDEQLPEKKRRLTPEQVHSLERSFEVENKLEPERKTQLANKLGLQPRQVAVWFQNRRARWKTKQLEKDYDELKASYDSLLSNFEYISKENEKLKAEVISLSEKLQTREAPPQEAAVSKISEAVPIGSLHLTVKLEDVISDDSGESCFRNNQYRDLVFVSESINSEEEDGSCDNGGSYFDEYVFPVEDHEEDDESLGWSIWS